MSMQRHDVEATLYKRHLPTGIAYANSKDSGEPALPRILVFDPVRAGVGGGGWGWETSQKN